MAETKKPIEKTAVTNKIYAWKIMRHRRRNVGKE